MEKQKDKIEYIPVTGEENLEDLCSLAQNIWREHFTPIIGAAQVEYMLEKFQSAPAVKTQIKEGYAYFLFYLNGTAIGYTGIHPEESSLFLSKLYLKKESRGKGYSRQAMDFLEGLCREKGLKKIWLTVNRHNPIAIRAYKAMGFSVIREQKADIGNGFVMDDYIMEKPL